MEPKIYRMYLAGKIGPSDWRHEIVAELREGITDCNATTPWPYRLNAILGQHTYVGPYFLPGGHGTATHGVRLNGKTGRYTRHQVLVQCTQALKQADLVFAWIDQPDVYGTLFELGVAFNHKTRIWVAGPTQFPELWLTYAAAERTEFRFPTAREALEVLLKTDHALEINLQVQMPNQ